MSFTDPRVYTQEVIGASDWPEYPYRAYAYSYVEGDLFGCGHTPQEAAEDLTIRIRMYLAWIDMIHPQPKPN